MTLEDKYEAKTTHESYYLDWEDLEKVVHRDLNERLVLPERTGRVVITINWDISGCVLKGARVQIDTIETTDLTGKKDWAKPENQ